MEKKRNSLNRTKHKYLWHKLDHIKKDIKHEKSEEINYKMLITIILLLLFYLFNFFFTWQHKIDLYTTE